MRLLSLFRTPSSAPGRRYSYHRAILLVGGAAVLFLMRPAAASAEAVALDRAVAASMLGIAVLTLLASSVLGRVNLRRRGAETPSSDLVSPAGRECRPDPRRAPGARHDGGHG
ncbi:MAG TPA: hypothetical protein VGR37_20110 [Longimicrobiaceae bacterium]|nr:hypothetical protein [Longimicrobiaceae bacterium]